MSSNECMQLLKHGFTGNVLMVYFYMRAFSARYPVLRVAVNASPIRFHLSPYRYQHLMAVLQSMAPPPDPAAQAAAGAGGPLRPLWLTDAEYTTKVRHILCSREAYTIARQPV